MTRISNIPIAQTTKEDNMNRSISKFLIATSLISTLVVAPIHAAAECAGRSENENALVTLLDSASIAHKDLPFIKMSLTNNARLANATNKQGIPLLRLVISHMENNTEGDSQYDVILKAHIVKLLLDAKAVVNTPEAWNCQPLVAAIEKGCADELVQSLLEAGANLESQEAAQYIVKKASIPYAHHRHPGFDGDGYVAPLESYQRRLAQHVLRHNKNKLDELNALITNIHASDSMTSAILSSYMQ